MREELERTFGQYIVTVRRSKYTECFDISISGDTGANFGLLYTNNFERFKNHPIGEEFDWNRPQVIGMDWEYGMIYSIKNWIYKNIYNDRFLRELKK